MYKRGQILGVATRKDPSKLTFMARVQENMDGKRKKIETSTDNWWFDVKKQVFTYKAVFADSRQILTEDIPLNAIAQFVQAEDQYLMEEERKVEQVLADVQTIRTNHIHEVALLTVEGEHLLVVDGSKTVYPIHSKTMKRLKVKHLHENSQMTGGYGRYLFKEG